MPTATLPRILGEAMNQSTRDMLLALRGGGPYTEAVVAWKRDGCPDIPVEPGGEMPEPWPGMGVAWTNARGERWLDVCAPRIDPEDGSWFAWVGDDMKIHQHQILAVYDGRREVWRRAT